MAAGASWCRWEDGDLLVRVRVQPRARREAIEGVRAGRLLVRVTAPPVGGRANEAVARLLARACGVAPSRVELVRGAGGREKTLRVRGARRLPWEEGGPA